MEAGEILMITNGEYSDFGHIGLFRVVVDFDAKLALQKYLDQHPEEQNDYSGSEYSFAAWLLRQGLVEDVDYKTWHVGAYGCFNRAEEPKQHDPSKDFWWRKEPA